MGEFLAEAQISVSANTKPFVDQFNKTVRAAEKTRVDVLVRADITGFKSDLREKVKKSASGVFADVLVRPDMTGFRTRLQEAVTKSARGVFADVTVKAGAVTKGVAAAAVAPGVTTGGVVDKRAAAAQLAINQAVAAGISARRRSTAAISDEEKLAQKLALQELHLKTATDAVTKAALSGVPAFLALAQAEETAARSALELSAAQATRSALNVPIGTSTADAISAAAAQRELGASMAASAEQRLAMDADLRAAGVMQARAIKENQALDDAAAKDFQANQKKRITSIGLELKELQKRAKAVELSAGISGRTRTRDILGQPIAAQFGGGADIGAEAAERNKALNESARVAKHVETELASARRTGIAALAVTADVEKQLAGTRGALRTATNAVLLAEENYVTALATEIPTVIALRDAELSRARAQAAALATTTASLEKEAQRAGAFASARRAIVAQIANLTGLRGAALTAASGFIAASAAFIAFRKAVGLAAELESELAVFQVTAGATADEMEEVHERAIELGRDITLPAVSAGDAAVALTELSKAGLDTQNAMDGAKGVLQLATAANINFTQATQLAASALNAFGLAGEEASHVADVLANSANQSQGSITDAGVALQQSAAVARQAGLSLEETVSALTLFARAGLRGSDAGTSLRTALIRLINPSEKAEEVINKLGLRIRTASGAIDLGVFQQFTDATKDLTAAQRDQALAIVFGQDAIRGAAILAREGAAGLSSQLNAIQQTGTAAEVASARTSGYAGSIENLKNQIETLGEQIGAALLPSLTLAANVLADFVGAITAASDGIADLRKEASKPINVFVDFIFGEAGPEVKEGVTKEVEGAVKTLLTGSIVAVVKLGTDNVAALREEARRADADLAAMAVRLQLLPEIFEELEHARSTVDLNKIVLEMKEVAKSMEGGGEESQAFRDNFAALIAQIQELSVQPDIEIPVTLKEDFESGFFTAGRINAETFSKSFMGVLETAFPGRTFQQILEAEFGPAAARAGAEIAKQMALAVGRASGQQAGFERKAITAQIDDDVDAEIDALRGSAASIQKQIDAINKATGGDPTDAALKKRTELQGDLNTTLDKIKSLEEGQAADAKTKAKEIQDAKNDADQAVLDALAPSVRKLDTRALIAQGTEGLRDDIAVAKATIKNNQRRIAIINAQFNDRKEANEQISKIRDENISLNQQIASDIQGIFDAQAAAFEVKVGAAAAEGNIEKQIALTKNRIAAINKLIREGKVEGKAMAALIEERRERRQQLEQLEDERLQAQLDFAQSIFDLTGNKNPLLRAIDAMIAEATQDAAQAKRGSVKWLKAKTEVNNLLKQRKEVIEGAAKDLKSGTTAFDLLSQFTDTFNATSGNLINTQQPFVSPADFTSPIAPFLTRKPTDQNKISFDTGGTPDSTDRAIERLIRALEDNTAATNGNSTANKGTGGFNAQYQANVVGQRYQAMADFWAARGAREWQNSAPGRGTA